MFFQINTYILIHFEKNSDSLLQNPFKILPSITRIDINRHIFDCFKYLQWRNKKEHCGI